MCMYIVYTCTHARAHTKLITIFIHVDMLHSGHTYIYVSTCSRNRGQTHSEKLA